MLTEMAVPFYLKRLHKIMKEAMLRCHLDLSGVTVLTEAASGAYLVTPVLAAMAGAKKTYALAKPSRYGSLKSVIENTRQLASLAGVTEGLEIITEKSESVVRESDLITNSGHVRPIDKKTVGWMKQGAVIPLMYEAWEFRPSDVDIEACREKGIAVAGTNECHPAVNVFSYLGIIAVKMLLDSGIAVYDNSILLLCDNAFEPFIRDGLAGAGAHVTLGRTLDDADPQISYDGILVALTPRGNFLLTDQDAGKIARRWPDAVIAQYWGDIDRGSFADVGLHLVPQEAPGTGHMGVSLGTVGPEPVVRLQTGGLKGGEVLLRSMRQGASAEQAVKDAEAAGWAQSLKL